MPASKALANLPTAYETFGSRQIGPSAAASSCLCEADSLRIEPCVQCFEIFFRFFFFSFFIISIILISYDAVCGAVFNIDQLGGAQVLLL